MSTEGTSLNPLLSRGECLKLLERWDLIEKNYHWEEVSEQIRKLESQLFSPDLWNNADKAAEINKQFTTLSKEFKVMKNAQECAFFVRYTVENQGQISLIEEEFSELLDFCNKYEEFKRFSEESDKLPALVKITAGAGGTEAQDWAGMIFRMYMLWGNTHGYEVSVQDLREAPVGINTATLQFSGLDYPYGLLKRETGIHRLVRVSPYNAQGKRMTSFCSVYVTPLIDDNFKVDVPESEISFEYFRSSGAGGQNVNKVESGVRARYWWTNPETKEKEEIIVENTETRDQPKNKENAIRILKSRVYQKELDIKRKKEKELENSKADNGWGNQKRSYVLDDCRVKDHFTGYQESNPDAILNGNIDGFLKANLLN